MPSLQGQKEMEWSYDHFAPSSQPQSVLGPLRKREYQTRQQQFRNKTPRRIGCPLRQQDQFPALGQRVLNPMNPSDTSSSGSISGSGVVSGTSGKGSELTTRIKSVHPLTPFTPLISRECPEADTSNSTMDWVATSSTPRRPASSHSRLQSPSSSPTIGSLSKSFMSIGQSMEFGCSAFSTNASSCSLSMPQGLRDTRLFGTQLGGGDRRMSTPSIPTTPKQSSQSRFENSESSSSASLLSSPSSSSSTLCRNTSTTQRPSSVYSARSWISSSTMSPSFFTPDEPNGYDTIDQPQRSSSPVISSCNPYRSDPVADYVSTRVPSIISEREYCVDGYDKVFAATWISDEEVLFGTKCNKIILLNTRTDRQVSIGRLDEYVLEDSNSALSRIEDMASKIGASSLGQMSRGNSTTAYTRPLGYTTVNNISDNFSGLDFASRIMERNLRLFNPGRRSSTPSFPSATSSRYGGVIASTAVAVPPSPVTSSTTSPTNLFGSGIVNASTGIRSMSISPSRTLLAIGSGEPFQVTIYSLPELEPVGMMYGHTDFVFALTWVSDTVLATGSRDGSMRIWSMESPVLTTLPSASRETQVRLPSITRKEERTRVRDLAFNKGSEQIMTLATDGFVKLWDRNSYTQIYKFGLNHPLETVCLTSSSEANLFAVGSQSHVSVLDPRASAVVHEAESCDEGCGVRSLDFKSHIITTGDGYGRIGFYDLRAQKYLDVSDDGEKTRRYHEIGPGWLDRDTALAGSLAGMAIRNAVYVMEYDSTGTRLFAAGGPIQLGLSGAYVGLWSWPVLLGSGIDLGVHIGMNAYDVEQIDRKIRDSGQSAYILLGVKIQQSLAVAITHEAVDNAFDHACQSIHETQDYFCFQGYNSLVDNLAHCIAKVTNIQVQCSGQGTITQQSS
ncbi:DDB1- and CUL4-associated factor 12 [Mortierella sp. AD094]|nr:DDB1- and CUL4-associated factor 12 [Mortierella sp. AD094]